MKDINPNTADDKEVRKLKRIAAEWAGRLHDLAEERLPMAYEEIPTLAQLTFEACKAWADASARFHAENPDLPQP